MQNKGWHDVPTVKKVTMTLDDTKVQVLSLGFGSVE